MADIYQVLKPLIYKLTPEQAHNSTIALLRIGGSMGLGRWMIRMMFKTSQDGPAVDVFGLHFKNPLGMAAGYDKDGFGWRGLAGLGFSHIELGTVTPRPQPGNPLPRTFRLVEDQAAINRMGFPNKGAEFMANRLKARCPKDLILGMNIGKNKDTPLEEAGEDYLKLLRVFAPLCDYLAVNVSSPNTPGLRQLQDSTLLEALLKPLSVERDALSTRLNKPVPILVKLAPDLTDAELEHSLDAVVNTGMDGLIISNTTISRPDTLKSKLAGETGGLSGLPLRDLNTIMVKKTVRMLNGRLPVVASGGVMTPQDAQEKLDAGAVLVQLYTGMIYRGPAFVKQILEAGLTV